MKLVNGKGEVVACTERKVLFRRMVRHNTLMRIGEIDAAELRWLRAKLLTFDTVPRWDGFWKGFMSKLERGTVLKGSK